MASWLSLVEVTNSMPSGHASGVSEKLLENALLASRNEYMYSKPYLNYPYVFQFDPIFLHY